jgi:polyisoprenoid-binding protein YceI
MKPLLNALLIAVAALAGPQLLSKTFDFKDPKGVNHVIFQLDAPLEFISGTGKDISGTATFDPNKPEALSGTILLKAASTSVPNQSMESHMHGEDWLDAKTYPEITFEIKSFKVSETSQSSYKGTIHGELTMLGKTHSVEAPTRITYINDGASQRGGNREGDLLVARSDFTISLEAYGIKLNALQKLKVSDTVELRVVIAGYETATGS